MKISKRYSFKSFKVFATKLLLQAPDGGPHKIFFCNIEIFGSLRVINNLHLIVTVGKFKNLLSSKKAHRRAKRMEICASGSGVYVVLWRHPRGEGRVARRRPLDVV